MPKGKRGRRKPDPVEIRFRLLVRPDIVKKLTAKRYNEVYRQWVLTGKLPDGFRVPPNASEWRNPGRRAGMDTWRTGDNQEAIDTLLARSLHAVNLKIEQVPQRKRRFAKPKVSRRRRTGSKPKGRK